MHQTKPLHLINPIGDICIARHDEVALYQIGHKNLTQFSAFVFESYAYHYSKKYHWHSTDHDLHLMQQSDQDQFHNSVHFEYKNAQHQTLGTIKATLKDDTVTFPIEYEFNIDINQLVEQLDIEVNEVWHLGRLAIDSNALRSQDLPFNGRQMMRQLLIHSLRVINHQSNNLMIAESDVLIFEIFKNFGINMQPIGDLQLCIGSPTYPVIITGRDINHWLALNPPSSERQAKNLKRNLK
ncbi:MAG: hypothetical protein HRT35_36670 [Algicola sp.]|nr:hypothetical protein [Algicola sp.]